MKQSHIVAFATNLPNFMSMVTMNLGILMMVTTPVIKQVRIMFGFGDYS